MDYPSYFCLAAGLSNVGASLLQRGHFRLASSVLKEAVSAMKGIELRDGKVHPSIEIEVILFRATVLLATTPYASPSSASTPCVNESVCISHEFPPVVIRALQADHKDARYNPIRVECSEPLHEHTLVAIVLYNYATSLMCIGKNNNEKSTTRHKALSHANTLLGLAQSVVVDLCYEGNNSMQRVLNLCLFGLITKVRVQVHTAFDRQTEASAALDLMSHILVGIKEYEEMVRVNAASAA
jgi:hypothetical protein